MKINPITTLLPALPSVLRPDSLSAKSKAAEPTTQNAAPVPVTSPSPLTEETKKNLAQATQEVSPASQHDHNVPPAQQARAALAENSGLATLPFGNIVSALARGLPLPTFIAASLSDDEPTSNPVTDESTTPPVSASYGEA